MLCHAALSEMLFVTWLKTPGTKFEPDVPGLALGFLRCRSINHLSAGLPSAFSSTETSTTMWQCSAVVAAPPGGAEGNRRQRPEPDRLQWVAPWLSSGSPSDAIPEPQIVGLCFFFNNVIYWVYVIAQMMIKQTHHLCKVEKGKTDCKLFGAERSVLCFVLCKVSCTFFGAIWVTVTTATYCVVLFKI